MVKQQDSQKIPSAFRKGLMQLLVLLVWILVWEGICLLVGQELLVPSPGQVFGKIFQLAGTALFWQITAITVSRILLGFVSGVVVGVIFAVLTSISATLYSFFKPLLAIVKATPVASFIILALVWINGGQIPTFISFLMVMPIVWGNVFKGIGQTDRDLLEMAKIYHLKKSDIIKKIYVGSVLPYFVPAAMTSMGLAWKAGIAAEVLAVPKYSIGTEMYDAKIYLETADLFAWSIVVIVISIVLEKIITSLLKKLLPEEKR